jgi:hypothetical protein
LGTAPQDVIAWGWWRHSPCCGRSKISDATSIVQTTKAKNADTNAINVAVCTKSPDPEDTVSSRENGRQCSGQYHEGGVMQGKEGEVRGSYPGDLLFGRPQHEQHGPKVLSYVLPMSRGTVASLVCSLTHASGFLQLPVAVSLFEIRRKQMWARDSRLPLFATR